MNLPIEIVPNTHPPVFRWRQIVDTLFGKKVVACEGVLPANVEQAVATTVGIAQQLIKENKQLKEKVEELLARLASSGENSPIRTHRKR